MLQHQVHGPRVVGCMSPITSRLKMSEAELSCQSQLDSGRGAGDFAGDKFVATARTLMVKKDSVNTKHSVGFPVICRQLKPGDFADAIRAARMKGSRFSLGHRGDFAEHLRGAGKIESASRPQLLQCCQ